MDGAIWNVNFYAITLFHQANRAAFTIRSRKDEGTLVEVSFPSTRVLAE